MRKRICCIISCLALVFQSSAFAVDTVNKYIPELDATVDLPTSSYIITSQTDTQDPALVALGLNIEEVIKQNESNNIVVDILSHDLSYEIVITVLSDDGIKEIWNLNEYPLSELEDMIDYLEDSYFEQTGITAINCGNTLQNGLRFLLFDLTQYQDNLPVYSRQYYTIFNGIAANITLHNLTGEAVSKDQLSLIETVVDSFTPAELQERPSLESDNANSNSTLNNSLNPATNASESSNLYSILVSAVVGGISAIIATLIYKLRKRK